MDLNKKLGELEALLFIYGESLTVKKIAAILGVKQDEAESLLSEFRKKLDEAGRGLALLKDEEKVQLVTKPEFNKVLEALVKEELSEDLTSASLEALAIVAYFGPISRSRVEYLRGVNSSFILRSLLLRGLVERFPDPERTNAFLYKSTFDLLKHLGVKGKENLPDYEKFQSLLAAFENQSYIPDKNGPQSETAPSGEI
jgi:segregation and condensation protein B